MLPLAACSKLCELTPAEGVSLLLKVAADKSAGVLDELISPTSRTSEVARNALLGAGLGAGVGGIREMRRDPEDRNVGRGVATSALLGGLLGGGGTAFAHGFTDWMEPTAAKVKDLRVEAHGKKHSTRAQAELAKLRGENVEMPPDAGASPDLTPTQNALDSQVVPPAVRNAFNTPGGATGLPGELFPGVNTPGETAATALNAIGAIGGAHVGNRYGHRLGMAVTSPGGLGGHVRNPALVRGWAGRDTYPGRVGYTLARGTGVAAGTLIGALLSHWGQHGVAKATGAY